MRPWLAACLVIVACCPVGAAPEPAAELANAGFEAAGPVAGQPAAWGQYVTFPGRASLALDDQVREAGQRSLRVTLGDATRCAVSQYVRVKEGGPYTLSCLLRGEKASRVQAQLQIEWFELVDWPRQIRLVATEMPSPWVSLTDRWTKVAATGSRPARGDLALVVIVLSTPPGQSGVAWADTAAFGPGAFPEPLVSNPGFEADVNDDGQPDDWGQASYGAGFALTRDTAVAHTGLASARLIGVPDHGDRSCYSQTTPVFTSPRKLRLSLWYRGAGQSVLLMQLLTPVGAQLLAGGIQYAALEATPPLGAEWQQFSQEIAVPQAARQAGTMRLALILYQKGEGTLWYDDVRVDLLD